MKILYLARLREALGCSAEVLETGPAIQNVDQLLAHLRSRGGAFAAELGEGRRFRVAVNQTVVEGSFPLSAEDEVAIFPPVTGG